VADATAKARNARRDNIMLSLPSRTVSTEVESPLLF
jgi:hypothetical protein